MNVSYVNSYVIYGNCQLLTSLVVGYLQLAKLHSFSIVFKKSGLVGGGETEAKQGKHGSRMFCLQCHADALLKVSEQSMAIP